jgi:hypothetical protein
MRLPIFGSSMPMAFCHKRIELTEYMAEVTSVVLDGHFVKAELATDL